MASPASRRCFPFSFPARLFKHISSEVNGGSPPGTGVKDAVGPGARLPSLPAQFLLPRPQRAISRTTTWFHPSAQGWSACGPTLGKTHPKHIPLSSASEERGQG